MFVTEQEDETLYDWVQEQNLKRQYGNLINCIDIGLRKGPTAFTKPFLWTLNHIAMASIHQFGGRFRKEPIYVGQHEPPHFNEVDEWMER